MKLCSTEQINDSSELINKINNLENKLNELEKNGITIHNSSKNVDNIYQKNPINVKPNATKLNEFSDKVKTNSDVQGLKKIEAWPNIVNNFKENGKIMLYSNLINTNAREVNDLIVGIEFPNGLTPFGKAILEKPENMSELTKMISMEYGKDMVVKLIDENFNVKPKGTNLTDEITKNIDMKINIIEE